MYLRRNNAIQLLKEMVNILEEQPEVGFFCIQPDLWRVGGVNVPSEECHRVGVKITKARLEALERNRIEDENIAKEKRGLKNV